MSSTKQWDISKALTVATLFYFFHNVGKFCLMPFLTLYFRQLGLGAPLVGIIFGFKHAVHLLWAPLCSFLAKNHHKQRFFIMTSLLLSAGVGSLFAYYPPLDKNIVSLFCNTSMPWKEQLNPPIDISVSVDENLNTTYAAPTDHQTTTGALNTLPSSVGKLATDPAMTSLDLEITTHQRFTDQFPVTSNTILEHQTKNVLGSGKAQKVMSSKSAASNSKQRSSLNNHTSPYATHPNVSHHPSIHERKVRDIGIDFTDNSLDPQHKIFLIVLVLVIIWEILAAPLEWIADDSLYEYLDFVDATDRHGKLWIWGYLGASMGSIFITFLVDNLNCFVIYDIPRVFFHFFCYGGFLIGTLFLSTLYPIHVSKKTEHSNKTVKALGFLGSDGRIVLTALTVFLLGAVGSTTQNFLFWQMQDVGSSELYMGLSIAVGLLSELTLYFFRNKLLKIFTFKWMVALGLFSLGVQCLYYSFLWAPWSVLAIQILNAFSSGVIWWAINSQVVDLASPGTERSLQLALRWLAYGCGSSTGSFASGFIISRFSLAVLYQACCITLLLWIIIFLLVQPKLPNTKKINYSRLLAADNSDMSDSDEEQDRDWLVTAMKDENSNRNW
ncbi:major facilitator superfamily domain-containing protein 6-like protein A isoform X1 [Xenopus laevis]|uniref:Major facilitator superfamily domain-containing protein 6-like protein A n=3 Tax=Xenopus laevis TaxID=8355 RepID=MF6LA_XENLA|nr:major facilitator superfamily domain-containing protein 6-like protein A [Xenopus laevis]XP_018093026.1 major facilitator superfamily domain-containing protein 6-like protein A isoform X1 [Xenopus laevis]XP_018093027.1 major facilitator superfamily domain-containing protein 6-like protein A isoform X1 [Xenopus laevis]XP_041433743.1 major facilitator superfamily domain-containing protein 6-like protein A isoform X1 [Xenopus laevis]Q68EU6.1 RecName: Full=Major facilitator superfamily domain-co